MSRSQPGVPVRAMSYSRIARPQLGHAGVLPTGCSGDLNKLNWGIAPLLALPTNSQQRNLFRDWFYHGLREQLAGAHVRSHPKSGHWLVGELPKQPRTQVPRAQERASARRKQTAFAPPRPGPIGSQRDFVRVVWREALLHAPFPSRRFQTELPGL